MNKAELVLTYTQGSTWLQHIEHSDTLCVCPTWFFTNCAPTGEYRHRFFPHEENASPNMNACPCGLADLETRDHILYECGRFKGVIGESIFDIIRFLEESHDMFCFQNNSLYDPTV